MASILVVGGTGYIGACFLTALRQKYSDLRITAYVRSTSSDDELSALNIDIVHGIFDDLEKLASLASENDIVVNAASSLDVNLTSALVKGLSAKRESKGTLIHVSGAGNFSDGGSSGNLDPESKIWNDASIEDIGKINDKMLNGACDKIILDAGAAAQITDFIVAPGGVYGQANTQIAKGNRGFFLNAVSDNCVRLGYSPYIGDGSAVFHLSEVNDVVSLMMLVFEKALKNEGPEGAYRRYYIAGGLDKTWKEIATIFATTLHKKGKIQEGTPREVTHDQAGFVAGLLGASILIKYDNAKALGYRPRGPDISDTLASSI